jgi:hypothetical protein
MQAFKICFLLTVISIPVELKCTSYIDNGYPAACPIYDKSDCKDPDDVRTCKRLSNSPR